jgi:hypothetical protein
MIRWSDITLQAAAQDTHTGKFQVDLLAYDRDGKIVNWQGGTLLVDLNPETYNAIRNSGFPEHAEIDLPNTDLYLATGIYDWNTGKAGTLEIPLHPGAPAATAAQNPAP